MSGPDAIFETGFGWISPKGNTSSCPCYGHMDCLRDHEDLDPEIRRLLDEMENRLDGCAAECQACAYAGGHPAWHCHDMLEAQLEGEIWKRLTKAGWLRIGSTCDHGSGCDIFVEGAPEAMEAQAPVLAVIRRRLRKTGNALHLEEKRCR